MVDSALRLASSRCHPFNGCSGQDARPANRLYSQPKKKTAESTVD